MTDYTSRRIHGLQITTPLDAGAVTQTRTLVFPDGTRLICRRRKTSDGDHWTAEIPIGLAKELFTDE